MADVKITDLAAYSVPTSTDVLAVVDVGSDLTKKVSIADLMENAGTGTAAAPGISFDGDNDTGVYHPANNQVALTAGGTQALLAESTGITIPGNLTVSGTTTTIDTTTLVVEDKNIEIGKVSTPSDTTADGGGITLKGASDKTITWVNSTDCWTFNQSVDVGGNVRIDSTGKLGVGTASPQDLLHLSGTVPDIRYTDTTGDEYKVGNNNGVFRVYNVTDANTPFVINGAGKVGVGTTSPVFKFHANETSGSSIAGLFQTNQTESFISFAASGTTATSTVRFGANGDNLIAFVNGGERLRIDSSGRVGIGTSTVGATLHLNNATEGDVYLKANSGDGGADRGLEIKSGTGAFTGSKHIFDAKSSGGQLEFRTASSPALFINQTQQVGIGTTSPLSKLNIKGTQGNWRVDPDSVSGEIQVLSTNTANSGFINYRLRANDSIFENGGIERLRINSSGNVGIGTSAPFDTLQVKTGANANFLFSTASTEPSLEIFNDAGNTNVPLNIRASEYKFKIQGTEKVRIDSSGRLLINNTTAGDNHPLQVTASSTSNAIAIIGRAADDIGSLTFYENDRSTNLGEIQYRQDHVNFRHRVGDIRFATGGVTERMRIDSSGKVGINESSPDRNLHVRKDGAYALKVGGESGAAYYLELGQPGASASPGINYTGTNASLRFLNNGTDVARFDSSGRLLVGGTFSVPVLDDTTAFNSPLQVQGSDASLTIARTIGSANLFLTRHQTVANNSPVGAVSFNGGDGNDLHQVAEISAEVDGTPGSNDMPGRLVFSTTADGASSPTERMRILSSGRVGINCNDPEYLLHLNSDHPGTNHERIDIQMSNDTTGHGAANGVQFGYQNIAGAYIWNFESTPIYFGTNNTERMRIDSAGQVMIGATSAAGLFSVHQSASSTANYINITNNATGSSSWSNGMLLGNNTSGDALCWQNENLNLLFGTNNLERLRIDSSGRLLVGTSSALTGSQPQYAKLVSVGNSAGGVGPGMLALGVSAAASAVSSGSNIGRIFFTDNAAGHYANITCQSDAAGGTNDYPGRLVFSTTADGSASPTERMRITQSGTIGMGSEEPMPDARLTLAGVNDVALGFKRRGSGKFDNAIHCDGGAMIFKGGANSNIVSGLNELMRIDSSGRLLVGTSSDVTGGAANAVLQARTTGGAQLVLARNDGAVVAADDIGKIIFISNAGAAGGTTAEIMSQAEATLSSSSKAGRLVFSTTASGATSATERMRIDSSGTMLIGNTIDNPGDTNTNAGIAFRQNGKYFFSCAADGGHINRNDDGAIIHCRRSGNLVGSVTVNSSGTSFNTNSDYRLKENVVDITDGITRVKQLQPRRFNFIVDDTTTVDGFIAHEAQAVVPEAVTGTHDEVDADGNAVIQGIDQSKLVPLLTAALQEAIAKIETLEQRLSDAGIA